MLQTILYCSLESEDVSAIAVTSVESGSSRLLYQSWRVMRWYRAFAEFDFKLCLGSAPISKLKPIPVH